MAKDSQGQVLCTDKPIFRYPLWFRPETAQADAADLSAIARYLVAYLFLE
jgi:hypothetical protein